MRTLFWKTSELVTLACFLMVTFALGVVFEARFSLSSMYNLPVISQAVRIFFGRPYDTLGLLDIEERARAQAKGVRFIIPLWSVGQDGFTDRAATVKWRKSQEITGWLGSYGGHLFYFTAGHKDFTSAPDKMFFGFFSGQELAAYTNDVYHSEIIDVTIVHLSPRTVPWIQPAILAKDLSDLRRFRTPLFVICNPEKFSVSVRAGIFYGMAAAGGGFSESFRVSFPGIGVEPGCSGAPVIGFDGTVKAMILRTDGYAVPSTALIQLVESKFFKK